MSEAPPRFEMDVYGTTGGGYRYDPDGQPHNPYGTTTATYGHPATGEDIEGDAPQNPFDPKFEVSPGYNVHGNTDPNYNPYPVGPGYNEGGLTAPNVSDGYQSPDPSSTGDIGGIEGQIENIYGSGNDQGNTEAEGIPSATGEEPWNVESQEAESGYTTDEWIYQGDGNFETADGSIANAGDYGVEVDDDWRAGGTYKVDESGNVVIADQEAEDQRRMDIFRDKVNDAYGGGNTNTSNNSTDIPNDGKDYGTAPTINGVPIPVADRKPGSYGSVPVVIPTGGNTNTGNPRPDNPPRGDPPPVIIPNNPSNEEPNVPDIDWTKLGGAAATAIGGAVNVSNQFDFLENSAEDQMAVNRQNVLDNTTLNNPNITNPYGSQTTTPGYVDEFGNVIAPQVTQTLNEGQQQLFDTETGIKQGLGDTALLGLEGVQDQFGSAYDPSGLTSRYQPDPNALGDYSNIDLDALSGRTVTPGITGRNAITEAMIAREQPRFDRAEEQMKNDLLIRGFNPGTEGFTEQTDEFGRAQNDFNLAAQAAGAQEQSRLFGLQSDLREQELFEQEVLRSGNSANREQQYLEQLGFGDFTDNRRNNELSEDLTLRNLPLNELNSLRSGTSPTVPQFQPFNGYNSRPADAQGPNYAQANLAGNAADGFFGLGGEILDWWGNRTPPVT